MKKILKDETETMAITSNIWTSLTNDSYISGTVHYISKDWVMLSYILETVSFPERDTGFNISKKMKEVLRRFEIEDSRVFAFVHDQVN